ncbi:MAG TPA: type II toxin-antitoxin system VapC family toxin [Phenylobacterium sp.]|uniref:type II toxin-antitoxin system VapC family toxin n=1 Tax=Phenylobacterium sp. TaxID=1871053 RepID=UPI002B49743C|nr:type II toxin-antitoxin system VapC family toxin [Phenylobacterium sp.]HKR87246.1 type II toxin-antitoxin system VapC family toxin [Phenylobacterium sp.]
MKLLLDTHLLLWAAGGSSRLTARAVERLEDPEADLLFSAASIWEVGIKSALGRPDFEVDPNVLRRELLDNGYEELAVTGAHGAHVAALPAIHRDPFDRMLVAQAQIEGVTLLTVDVNIVRYPGPIESVR